MEENRVEPLKQDIIIIIIIIIMYMGHKLTRWDADSEVAEVDD